MAVAEPPLRSALTDPESGMLNPVWDRFFRDVFAASGSYSGTPHPTGFMAPKVGSVPVGWLLIEEKTIGNRDSGATSLAHEGARDLYVAIWNTMPDGTCPVSSGRGTSALADFKANKTIALPPCPGRVMGCSGSMTGLTTRAAGALVGTETHTLTATESGIAAHTHTVTDAGHNHTQNAHTHTQDSHNHTQNSHLHTDAGHNHTQNAHTHGAGSYVVTHYNSGATATNVPANVNPFAAGGATTAITGTSGSTTATNNLGSADVQPTTATNIATTATNQNTTATNNANTTGLTVDAVAATTAASSHNNMQPTLFLPWIIKL